MAQDKGLEFLDYIIILLKHKIAILILFFSILIASYLCIYFFIDEEFESTALIVPTEDDALSGISSLMKDFKGLPLGLGSQSLVEATDLYTTIIFSRSSLETLIRKFDLIKEFEVKNMEDALKVIEKKINSDVTDENAYEISVRASSPRKAAEMVNYLLEYLNETVIKLNIQKSKNNREFLGQRYEDIALKLSMAEDSLQKYQEQSGMLEAKEQLKLVLGAYSELEEGLLEKQLQLSVMEKTLPEGSPMTEKFKVEYTLFKNELDKIKQSGKDNSVFLAFSSLPQKAKSYFRHFRDVEIYQKVLEFVLPLYEQSRFEEQKNIPVLQIIDHGSVPVKRAYPKRTLLSLLFTVAITFLYIFYLITSELFRSSTNAKILTIRNQLKHLTWTTKQT